MLKRLLLASALLVGAICAAYGQSAVYQQNQVLAGPTSGSGHGSPRLLVGADLPNPGSSTKGGIESLTCAAHQWLNTISVAGVPACSQPSVSDISGTLAINQGGTGQVTAAAAIAALMPVPTRAGDFAYWNGSAWVPLAGNNSGTNCFQENSSGVPTWNTCGAGGSAIVSPQGRLTLATGTPVMTVSNTSQTTLYYDCYRGGASVPVYNGSSDVALSITACEISSAMQSSGTGVLNANGVFDVWGISVTGALHICVATNGSGGGWASDIGGSNTTRGTGYTQLDTTSRTYVTNKNAISHCYEGSTDRGSVGANQATYLGTILTDASNAGEVSYTFGSSASGGGGARFGVWNAYNRVRVNTMVQDSTTSWTYNVATTWRSADNSTTARITAVFGTNEDGVEVTYNAIGQAGTASFIISGVGLDSTSSAAAGSSTGWSSSVGATIPLPARFSGTAGSGLHFFQAIEYNSTTTAASWFGNTSQAISGLSGSFRM